MSVIPIIASAEDVPGAVRHAERNTNARWYVAKRAQALGATELVPASWGLTADASDAKRKRASTIQGTDSFPIENKDDVRKAVKAYGRAKDKEKAKKHILSMARKLGAMDLIPDDWKATTASGLTPGQEGGTIDGMTIVAAAHWDSNLHPRDREGQFISVGDVMDIFSVSGSTTPMWSGKVVGNSKVDGKDHVDVEVTSEGGMSPGVGKTISVPVTRVAAKPEAKAKLDAPAEPAEPVAETAKPDLKAVPDAAPAAPTTDKRDISNIDRTAPKSPAELDAKIAHRVGRADANPQSRVPDADREFYDSAEGKSFKDGTHPTSGKPGWHPAPVNNDPTRMVADKRLWERTDDGLWQTQTKNPQGPQTPSAEDASVVEALNRKYDSMTGADEDPFDVSDDEADLEAADDGHVIQVNQTAGDDSPADLDEAAGSILEEDDPSQFTPGEISHIADRLNEAGLPDRAQEISDWYANSTDDDASLGDDPEGSLEDDPDYQDEVAGDSAASYADALLQEAQSYSQDNADEGEPDADLDGQIKLVQDAIDGGDEADILDRANHLRGMLLTSYADDDELPAPPEGDDDPDYEEHPEVPTDFGTYEEQNYDPAEDPELHSANALEQTDLGTTLTQTAREDMQSFADFFDVDSGEGSWASGLKDYQFEQLGASLDDYTDDPEAVGGWQADKLRGLTDFAVRHNVDPYDALVAREQGSRLGWSMEEQLRNVLAGEPLEEQNPTALRRIEGFLRSNPLRNESFNPDDEDAFTPSAVAREIAAYLDGEGSDDFGFTPDDSEAGAPGDPEPMAFAEDTPEAAKFAEDLANEPSPLDEWADRLGLETLETRNSDSLDFHEVSKTALTQLAEEVYGDDPLPDNLKLENHPDTKDAVEAATAKGGSAADFPELSVGALKSYLEDVRANQGGEEDRVDTQISQETFEEIASYAQQAADNNLDVQPLMDVLEDKGVTSRNAIRDAIGQLNTGPNAHDSDRLDDLLSKLDEGTSGGTLDTPEPEPESEGIIPADMSPDGSSPLATNPYGGPQPEKGTPEWTAKNTLGMSLMRAADKSSHDYTPEQTGDDIQSIFNAATNAGAHKELASLMTKLKLGGKQRKRNRDLLDSYRGDGIAQKIEEKDASGAADLPEGGQSTDEAATDLPEAPPVPEAEAPAGVPSYLTNGTGSTIPGNSKVKTYGPIADDTPVDILVAYLDRLKGGQAANQRDNPKYRLEVKRIEKAIAAKSGNTPVGTGGAPGTTDAERIERLEREKAALRKRLESTGNTPASDTARLKQVNKSLDKLKGQDAPKEVPAIEEDRALSQSPEALSDGALENNIANMKALINSGAASSADRSRYNALRREQRDREDAKKPDSQLIAEAQANWNEALQEGYMVGNVVDTTQFRIDSVLQDLRNGETSILVKDDVEQYLTRAQALAVLRKLGMDTTEFEKKGTPGKA